MFDFSDDTRGRHVRHREQTRPVFVVGFWKLFLTAELPAWGLCTQANIKAANIPPGAGIHWTGVLPAPIS